MSRSYQLVPGAGWRLVDLTDWMWPVRGATCTAPRFEATYLLRRKKKNGLAFRLFEGSVRIPRVAIADSQADSRADSSADSSADSRTPAAHSEQWSSMSAKSDSVSDADCVDAVPSHTVVPSRTVVPAVVPAAVPAVVPSTVVPAVIPAAPAAHIH